MSFPTETNGILHRTTCPARVDSKTYGIKPSIFNRWNVQTCLFKNYLPFEASLLSSLLALFSRKREGDFQHSVKINSFLVISE